MKYIKRYSSPLGDIIITSDAVALTGLWFEGQRFLPKNIATEFKVGEIAIFEQTVSWLDLYFSGEQADFMPAIHLDGSAFRLEVWSLLRKIRYGETTTYKNIADEIANRRGTKSVSAQAVGGAIGHNPISIIIPCHRVVGTDGSLVGYAGGLDKKRDLLLLEKVKINQYKIVK